MTGHNFETVTTPVEAVDRLEHLYERATTSLRHSVEQFLTSGASSAGRRSSFRYPQLRVTYRPDGVQPSSQRAFAKFPEAGVYTTTVTQPAAFRSYLLEQKHPRSGK